MARQVRAVFDRVELARDWSYSTILDLDAGFRLILDDLPERWTLAADEQEQEAPMQRFQRHFVLEGLHNRIFRLHRPLLSKAHKNPKYKFSAVSPGSPSAHPLIRLGAHSPGLIGCLPEIGASRCCLDPQVRGTLRETLRTFLTFSGLPQHARSRQRRAIYLLARLRRRARPV